eukprot:CAMPEP_0181065054 /NCGR_PEP_ID=MMETSP1070-20121207/24533_1 /TAXON_ID=265543 /ORGANISM="Minutocellus polymorphus, Strain NH13" /LENGTH=35 /DNA_ID= /DNA_START= /DNA_END= /DNA_ORIENTATION=
MTNIYMPIRTHAMQTQNPQREHRTYRISLALVSFS